MGGLSGLRPGPGSVNESHPFSSGQEAVDTHGGRQAGGQGSQYGHLEPALSPRRASLPSSSLRMAFGASARRPSLEWLVTHVTRRQSSALGTVAVPLHSRLCCDDIRLWRCHVSLFVRSPSFPLVNSGPEGKDLMLLDQCHHVHGLFQTLHGPREHGLRVAHGLKGRQRREHFALSVETIHSQAWARGWCIVTGSCILLSSRLETGMRASVGMPSQALPGRRAVVADSTHMSEVCPPSCLAA